MRSDPRAQRAASASALCVALAVAGAARGEPEAPRAVAPSADALAAAKDLFARGLALLDAGEVERALDHFMRSRALVPGKGNTVNAAHCLERLGRFDEALELYDEVVARFAGELGADNQRRLLPSMEALRARVAGVVVTSNVDGAVLVDGRARGRLPLPGALRVLPGPHAIRILKDGYETAEGRFSAALGATARVDLLLKPLAAAGRLRIEDPRNEGAEVFVDRVRVGVVPWEGTVSPGDHLAWTAAPERGSAPARAVVIQGQIAVVELHSERLGPVASIAAEPASAELRLDGIPLGPSPWSGRLPVGPHEVAASEPGYVTATTRFEEAEPGGAPARVVVTLAVDPQHPRWPRRPAGKIRFEAFGAVAVGRGLGSDAGAWCAPSGCGRALGSAVGARAGFRFPSGLTIEALGGYMDLGASFSRSRAATFTSEGVSRRVTYQLDDALGVRGPFAGAAVGWAAALPRGFALVSRIAGGVLFAGSSDPISGRAVTGSGAAPVVVSDRSEVVTSSLPFVAPELGVEASVRGFHAGAGVGFAAFLGAGPTFSHDLLEVSPTGCTRTSPGSPACAPASHLVASERAYRPFGVVMPSLSVGYGF